MSDLAGRRVRPAHRSDFTLAHMLDPEQPLPDPETGEIFDKNGKKLGPFYDLEDIDTGEIVKHGS